MYRHTPSLPDALPISWLIKREPRRLPCFTIKREAKPAEIGANGVDIFFPRPFGIGVVKTKQNAPAILSRPHPVMKRRADIADMKIAGWGGSEPCGEGQIFSPHSLLPYAAPRRSGVIRAKQICAISTHLPNS